MTVQAAIAAPNPMATQAGLNALARGGNAVDAAVAAMVTASVTEPGIIGPLGGCFLNIWPVHGEPCVIDGNVEMPGRSAPKDRFGAGLIECVTTYGGGMTTYAGPGSVATPGCSPRWERRTGSLAQRTGRACSTPRPGACATASR